MTPEENITYSEIDEFKTDELSFYDGLCIGLSLGFVLVAAIVYLWR